MLIYETPDPAASGKGSSSKTNIFLVMKTLEISDDAIRKDKPVADVRVTSSIIRQGHKPAAFESSW